MSHYILDENDNPKAVDFTEYYAWQQQHGRDGIGFKLAQNSNGTSLVSTVYLGLDHYFGTCNPNETRPVLWETMLFCDNEELNNYCERSCTRAEAMEVHKRFCEKYLGEKK